MHSLSSHSQFPYLFIISYCIQNSYELCKHPSCRFGELKKAVPRITNTILSTMLRDLESLGIVHREQFNEIPPHVEYSLTDKEKALLPVFTELAKWGEAHLTDLSDPSKPTEP